MTEKTRQEQRRRIAEVFAKIDDNFSLAKACEQLLDEGVEMALLFRKAKAIFGPWIEDYYFEPEGAREFLNTMRPFWARGLELETMLDKIEEFVRDEAFYFFLYKRGPRYGMKFNKLEIGKRFLAKFTEYAHTHFKLLARGFDLDSDDLVEIITDPAVVGTVGIIPDTYETILEDCLDLDLFEYNINDIASRYLDRIGYSTAPIWLVEVMGRLIDNGADVIDIDEFGNNVLELKEKEGVNWSSVDQDFYENLLEKYGADQRIIEALMSEDDRDYY